MWSGGEIAVAGKAFCSIFLEDLESLSSGGALELE